jgi:poly-gamma-glutamate biosynthesis protein PgsC/CapC
MPLTEAIAIGLLAGFLLYEWCGLSPGGFVVPGYVALQLDRPWVLGATLAACLLAWGIVRGLSRWLIIYGRRRFLLMVLAGFACQGLVEAALRTLPGPVPPTEVIGFIIPGLIANELDRQGAMPTFAALAILAVIVRLVLAATGLLPVW